MLAFLRISDLHFEELGPLRLQLMGILKDERMAGVKRFARTIRKDRRDKPREVLRLDEFLTQDNPFACS